MTDAGLPGLGLRLGSEVLRSPNGVWYSASGADGKPVGVLRFDPERVTGPRLDQLVERVVAARNGMLEGVLPIVDLVEDSGRVWLITSVLPVAATADRTERLLLDAGPPSGVVNQGPANQGPPNQAGVNTGGMPYAAGMGPMTGGGTPQGTPQGVWRPEVDLGEQYRMSPPTPQPQWVEDRSVADRPSRRSGPLLIALLVVAVIAGAGGAAAYYYKNKPTAGTALHVSAATVQQGAVLTWNGTQQPSGTAATASNICHSVVQVIATLQTNRGQGSFNYQWLIPGGSSSTPQVIQKSATVSSSDSSPYQLVLDWTLSLHGTGEVTASFTILTSAVTPTTIAPATVTLPYNCP